MQQFRSNIQLYNEDCLPAMRQMQDNEFDLAIVDPPYVVGADDGKFGRGGKRAKNRIIRNDLKKYHSVLPEREYFNELFRISKNQIIWGANYYPMHLNHSGWIVWDKDKKDGMLSMAELAYQSIDKRVMIYKHTWEGFRRGIGSFEESLSRTIHPNQKPNKLYEWLITNYAKQGDKILDTHLGSGSIAIACWDLGFDLTGYEIDKEYFDAAVKRLENHKAQLQLF